MSRTHWNPGMRIGLGLAVMALTGASQADDRAHPHPRPIQTTTCLVEGQFSCQEHEITYSIKGLYCTEDCLVLSKLNNCQLTNQCHWDAGSGCFLKDVCVELSSLQNCQRWERRAICR